MTLLGEQYYWNTVSVLIVMETVFVVANMKRPVNLFAAEVERSLGSRHYLDRRS